MSDEEAADTPVRRRPIVAAALVSVRADGRRVDRSFQTDARAEPAHPEGGTASGAFLRSGRKADGSTGRFRRMHGQSPRILKAAPRAVPSFGPGGRPTGRPVVSDGCTGRARAS